MRAAQLAMAIVMVTAAASIAAPSQADGFIRIGAEARWVPVSAESMQQNEQDLAPRRTLDSSGVGVRGLVGFKYLSLGGKMNLTRNVYDDDELTYSQLDLNAHIRSGMPLTRLRFFGEAGPTVAFDIGEVGYNVALGAEVDVLGWPLVDMNLGIAAQYVHVPIGAGADSLRVNNGLRAMATLGVDFSLIE